MNHGSLFSGIGGFDLAAEWMGWENVFHCEIEDYKRVELNKKFPKSISYADVSTVDFRKYRGLFLLTGGFPCQDASIAKQDGKGQQGLQGSRTSLFYQMVRAIEEIRPKYVVAENVANILKTNGGSDFSSILTELSRMGYNAEWRVCRASEVGAPHHRARLYLVAYSNGIRLQKMETFFRGISEKTSPITWQFAGATISALRGGRWQSEPPILCVDNGLSGKLVRQHIHGYGNAVVPEIPYRIFKAIEEYENLK